MKKFLYLSVLSILLACSSEQKTEQAYSLQPTDQYLAYEIDEETRVPLYHMYTFEVNGTEYLTFPNRETRTLLIYELLSGKFVKKFSFDAEGPNIGR